MEIVPRKPVAGENPNRRFVGLVDDTGHVRGLFTPLREPITNEQQPKVSILEFDAQIRAQGQIPVYDEGGSIIASYPDPKVDDH